MMCKGGPSRELQPTALFFGNCQMQILQRRRQKLLHHLPGHLKKQKNLEEELGFDLFIRSNRGITLTPKGEIFYADVCKILDIKASWQALAADHAKSLRTVHIVTSTANYCLIIKSLLAMLQHLNQTSTSSSASSPSTTSSTKSKRTATSSSSTTNTAVNLSIMSSPKAVACR